MTDEFVIDTPTLLLADRSTLERTAECPAQAKFVADRRVITSSHLTETGSAIHAAFGDVLTEYVSSRGNLSLSDMVDTLKQQLCASRPDVQQSAIQASRASLYSWAKYISGIHHDNILRWDGGEGDRCGQLACDMEDLGVRLTSEVDLLHTGRATEVVDEVDYKTGFKLHTAADVESSFQFRFHAFLILKNYPGVECVNIRVWNTRLNNLTYRVTWKRDDLYALEYQIRNTVMNWKRYRETPAEQCPTWPTQEKCELCPAAALCPAVPADIQQFAADPEGLVEAMVATKAKLDALTKLAAGHVERTGRDIVTSSGAAFGTGKPKAQRKPTQSLYAVKGNDGDD